MEPKSRAELRRELVAFLETICRPDAPPVDLGDEASFVEAGLLDSLALLEIVSHLEETYGVRFDERGVVPEELGTLGGLLALIERSRS